MSIAMRLFSVAGVLILAAVSVQAAASPSYEVVDPDGIYFRSIRGKHPKAPGVLEADRGGRSVYAEAPKLREAAGRLADALDRSIRETQEGSRA